MNDNIPTSILNQKTLAQVQQHYNIINENSNDLVDYIDFIDNENVRQPIFKLEFLNKSDETPYSSIEDTIINGDGSLNVSLNNGGVRRACSFTLVNNDHQYTKMFANLSIGSKFRLSLGYMLYDKPIYFVQGTFVFDDPTLNSSPLSKTIAINGTDKWSMLNGTNGGILETTYEVKKGSKLKGVIERTLALDIVYDPIPPNIEASIENFEIPLDIVKEAGSNVAELLMDVVSSANAYIYYDVNGVCTVRPFEYDEVKGSTHHFRMQDINYISAGRTYNYNTLYNAVYVIADNLQNESVPIYAEAINIEPTDPNSLGNLGYKKYKPITEHLKGITTQSLADQRCRYELKRLSALQSTLSITCMPLYHIVEDSIVTITDPHIDASGERFLVNGFTIPISTGGEMTLSVVKAMGYF